VSPQGPPQGARVQGGTDWGSESGGHPLIDILQQAAEGCLDNPVACWVRWHLKAHSPQAGLGACPQRCVGGRVGGTMGPEPRLQLRLLLTGGKAEARVLPNQGRVHIPRAGMARIMGRVIPQERQRMRHQGTAAGWDLGAFLGDISQRLYGLQAPRDAVAIPIATAGLHQRTCRRGQQTRLGHFFGGRGDREARLIAWHPHLADRRGGYCPNRKEPVATATDPREPHGMVGESTGDVPVQKGEPANHWRAHRAYADPQEGTCDQRQSRGPIT
jgi:hypothetical protein